MTAKRILLLRSYLVSHLGWEEEAAGIQILAAFCSNKRGFVVTVSFYE
jgi:hypothetical protein